MDLLGIRLDVVPGSRVAGSAHENWEAGVGTAEVDGVGVRGLCLAFLAFSLECRANRDRDFCSFLCDCMANNFFSLPSRE